MFRFAIALLLSVSIAGQALAAKRELTAAEKSVVVKTVAHELVDPDSARFRWAPYSFKAGATANFYCGQVNSKNRMGGYTGFQGFSVTTLSRADQVVGAVVLDVFPLDAEHLAIAEKSAGCSGAEILDAG